MGKSLPWHKSKLPLNDHRAVRAPDGTPTHLVFIRACLNTRADRKALYTVELRMQKVSPFLDDAQLAFRGGMMGRMSPRRRATYVLLLDEGFDTERQLRRRLYELTLTWENYVMAEMI